MLLRFPLDLVPNNACELWIPLKRSYEHRRLDLTAIDINQMSDFLEIFTDDRLSIHAATRVESVLGSAAISTKSREA